MNDQAEETTGNQEEKILRVVTSKEIAWITSVLAGIKNKGDGFGEIKILVKRGRIMKVWDAGEQIPNIYDD